LSENKNEAAGSLKAVIFDMDGILIDSEPFWREAEIAAFARIGVRLTESMCLETMGLRVDEVIHYWHRKFRWENFVPGELENQITGGVIDLIRLKGEAKQGMSEAFEFFKDKNLKIALASSSSYKIIHAVIEHLGIAGAFECIYSAEEEKYGKPHPGVYLATAEKLRAAPSECLAIEDSFNGVLAAKAAKMKCIAVPEPLTRSDPRFVIADVVLDSLLDINPEIWNELNK
jgi:beta-phosphoglucomutase-like phosphatase (HAD superfamily)